MLSAAVVAAALFLAPLSVSADCFNYGCQYPGNVISTLPGVADKATCQATCQSTLGCNYFTFNGMNNNCFLQNVNAPLDCTWDPRVVCAPAFCPPTNDCFFQGCDYPGNDISTLPGTASGSACQAACQANSGCYFFTFNGVNNMCFLKSASTPLNCVYQSIILCGPKNCPAFTPTTPSQCSSSPVNQPNINYLGMGYDVIKGNPRSFTNNARPDPGFRNPAVCPPTASQVNVLQDLICASTVTSQTITGTTSYQNSLSIDVDVGGEAFGVQFTASNDYSSVQSGTANSQNYYMDSVATCSVYSADLFDNLAVATPGFALAVSQLPLTTASDPAYTHFIQTYGTHYVSSATWGAKAIVHNTFSQAGWAKMTSVVNNVNATASSESFYNLSGGLAVGVSSAQNQSFSQSRSSSQQASFGSPFPSGSVSDWSSSVATSPYILPIAFSLQPLASLLTPQYIPNVSPTNLQAIATLTSQAVRNYAAANGRPPTADFTPPTFSINVNNPTPPAIPEQGVSTSAYCAPGLTLMSCGLQNSQKNNAESFRGFSPVGYTNCYSYDYYGVNVVPWCSSGVKGLTWSKLSSSGVFNVACPAGTTVMGCHTVPNRSLHVNGEQYRAYYPYRDSSGNYGCTCYDYYGTECGATCATNIGNWNYVQTSGSGTWTATCPDGTFVLGCGIDPRGSSGAEKFRTSSVNSLNSCQCYDYYGSTCYAICGTFTY